MTPFRQLQQQLNGLHRLARWQRGIRLGLRAIWLGASGVLLGWVLHTWLGWLPDSYAWVGLGLALMLIPITSFILSLTTAGKWAWKMDRLLGLDEQVSTAWEVAQHRRRGELNEALVQDAAQSLPQIRQRMLQRGWYLRGDLAATLVVLLLGGVLLGSGALQPFGALLEHAPAAVPPAAVRPLPQAQAETDPHQPAPTDQSALESQPAPAGEGSGESAAPEAGNAPAQNPGSGIDPQIGSALRQLGRELSQQAGTYALGQALENLDLDGAANAMEGLQDGLDELSPESRQQMAEAMRQAAEALEQVEGAPPIASDLNEAAQSLQEGSNDAGQDLGQVAEDLRQLAGQIGASPQAGSGGAEMGSASGNPDPLRRLENEGGDLSLPLNDTAESGMLDPARPEGSGEGTASGSLDAAGSEQENSLQNPLVPNSYAWKWRDVVSEYFQR
ncbi:MAG: hypothetical protein VB089_16550 [Anaerolineaceae bacterium]|nr:hypothetical protein [Anaerolineaceae bacterium]